LNALVLAASLAAASPQQAAQDTITPTFDWPAGTILQGQATATQTQAQGGQEIPGQTVEVSFTRTISDHPQGLLVTSEVQGDGADALPAYIVSEAGEFLGVQGVDDIVARMREQLLAAARAQSGGQVPPEARQMAEQMFNAESVEASAREEHDVLVGMWAGRTLRRNNVMMTRMQVPGAVTPGALPTEVEYVWRGFAPCADGEAEDSCIQLEATFFPDGNALAIAFEMAITSQNAGAELYVNRASQTRTVSILAEPDGLIPRRVEDRTEAEFDVEADGEFVDLTLTQVETTTFTVGGGLQR
jgi:hypothetical protein